MGWLSDTWESVKENASDICHGVLDAAGFIPAVGAVPDVINAGIYALEGNGLDAGLSLAAAVPVVGDISAGVGKGGKWLSKAGKWFLESKAGKKVVPTLLSALEKCKFLAGRFAEFCKTKWGKIKTGAKGFFNGGKNFFKDKLDKIKKWFKKIKEKFKKKGNGETIENDILGKPRTGSALKVDEVKPIYKVDPETGKLYMAQEFPAGAQAHGFNDMVDNYAGYATKSPIPNGELYQLEGSLNGVDGRFEWIVQDGNVTHRMFIQNGTMNGVPIKS